MKNNMCKGNEFGFEKSHTFLSLASYVSLRQETKQISMSEICKAHTCYVWNTNNNVKLLFATTVRLLSKHSDAKIAQLKHHKDV